MGDDPVEVRVLFAALEEDPAQAPGLPGEERYSPTRVVPNIIVRRLTS